MVHKLKIVCIGFSVVVAIGVVVSLPPIPQDMAYHAFADDMRLWGMANAKNVLSNLAFVIAGIVGLIKIRSLPQAKVTRMWRFFYSAVVLVGLGSAYYHWFPSNETLVWDRLPMTLCFAALTACVCAERIGAKVGRLLFVPLIVSGVLSVLYWWVTEKYGVGDLRPYIFVQYFPMILLPLLLLLFPKPAKPNTSYWVLLASYIIAKVFELQDYQVYSLTSHVVSGHTVKHLLAAAGIMLLSSDSLAELHNNNAKIAAAKQYLTKKGIL